MPAKRLFARSDHRDRVPADDPPDAALHLLVAREVGLLLGADGVDVAGLGERRQPDLELARPLEELVDAGTGRGSRPRRLDDLVERVQPLVGLVGIDVGQLVLELVEVHTGGRVAHPLGRCGRPDVAVGFRRGRTAVVSGAAIGRTAQERR